METNLKRIAAHVGHQRNANSDTGENPRKKSPIAGKQPSFCCNTPAMAIA
jgi:hypothetical protein